MGLVVVQRRHEEASFSSAPLDAMPAAMARATAALMACLAADATPPVHLDAASTVTGVGIGATAYRGRACVVHDLMTAFDRLEPGDVLGLISDGIYEYENETGALFGRQGVVRVIDQHPDAGAQELVDLIMAAARHHGGKARQADDITIVLVRRLPE